MKRLGESDTAYRARVRREFGETMADQTRRVAGLAACGHAETLGALTGQPCGACVRKAHRRAVR